MIYRSAFVGARPMSDYDLYQQQRGDALMAAQIGMAREDRDQRMAADFAQQRIDEDARQANMADQRFYAGQDHDAAKTSYLTDADFAQKRMGYDFQAQQGAREAGWQADRDARLAGFQADRDAKYQSFLMDQDQQQQAARLGEIEYRHNLDVDAKNEERRQYLLSQGYDYTDIDRKKLDQLDRDEANLKIEFSSPGTQIREKAFYNKLQEIRRQRQMFMPTVQKQDPVEMARQKIGRDPSTGILFTMDHKGDIKFQMPPKGDGSASGLSSGFGRMTDAVKKHMIDKSIEMASKADITMGDSRNPLDHMETIKKLYQALDGTGGGSASPALSMENAPPQVQQAMEFIGRVEQYRKTGQPIQNPESIKQLEAARNLVRAWGDSQRQQPGQAQPMPQVAPMMPQRGPATMAPMPGGGMPPQAAPDPFSQGQVPVGPQGTQVMPGGQRAIADAAVRTFNGMRPGDVVKVIPNTPAAQEALRRLRGRQPGYEGGRIIQGQQAPMIPQQQPMVQQPAMQQPHPQQVVPEQIPGEMTEQQQQQLRGQLGMNAQGQSQPVIKSETLKQWQGVAQKSGDERVQSIVNLASRATSPEVVQAADVFMRAMQSGKPPIPGSREYYLLGQAIRVLEANGINTQERTKAKPRPAPTEATDGLGWGIN